MTNLQSMRDKRLIKSSAQCWTVLGVAFQLLKPSVLCKKEFLPFLSLRRFLNCSKLASYQFVYFQLKKVDLILMKSPIIEIECTDVIDGFSKLPAKAEASRKKLNEDLTIPLVLSMY